MSFLTRARDECSDEPGVAESLMMSKTRSSQQRIGAYGESLAALLVQKSGCWLPRNQGEDYGVDLEIELTEPSVAGEILKVQVKSAENVGRRSGEIEGILPRSMVHLGENLRVPLLLVVVETSTDRAWYLWVQQWWLHARQSGARFDQLPESSTVWIPESKELTAGLQGELKNVARGQTREQLVLSLSDTVRAAMHHKASTLLAPLVDLLVGVGPLPDSFPITEVIEGVVRMGGKIWDTHEGHIESRTLFTICRSFGDRFTVDEIDQLVWREDGYSRTGINALDLLYTYFPMHVGSLGLPARFASRADRRPAFYCALREAQPTASAAAGFQAYGLQIGYVDEWQLLDKVANRGRSAILDYVVPV